MIMTKLNTLSKLVLICGLATATLGAGSVLAKGDGHKQGHSQARFLLSERSVEKLNLTDEQQTKLKTIFETQKTQMKALKGDEKEERKAMREAHKAKMDALLSAATCDEKAAKEILNERHEKGVEFGLIKLKTQHQVMQVLNAEQKEKFAKMQKRMNKKHRNQKS